jgi:hypothetical protein
VQSLFKVHSTQSPVPSQRLPLPCEQIVRALDGVWVGVPSAHASSVHCRPSSATSLSSSRMLTAPLPSHTASRQSPAVCTETRLPAASGASPQRPARQIGAAHSLAGSGQSVCRTHSRGPASCPR